MRKAVQAAARRNQRRRENPPPPPPTEAPKEQLQQQKHQQQQKDPNAQQADATKRKTSPEEAALTGKNYRLAKELSELRVRHREECKNVTRLTMENMNLASRCREALSHVAMLKRELAAHQRRSAEALAMQRQNAEARAMAAAAAAAQNSIIATPPPSTPTAAVATSGTAPEQVLSTPKANRSLEGLEVVTSTPTAGHNTPPLPLASPVAADSPLATSTTPKLTPRRAVDVARELEILDETVASHALKAQAAASTPTAVTETEPEEEEESPHATLSEPVDSDDFEEEDLSTTNQLHPPQSVDDVPGHRPPPIQVDTQENNNNNVNSNDATPSAMVSPVKTYFPHSASPKVDNNYDDEYPSDFSAVRKRAAVRPKLGMLGGFAEGEDEGSSHSLGKKSSLDAFEASFATDFPDSFSPRDNVVEEKKSEIYNPFQSPAKPKPSTARVEPDHRKDPPGKIRTSQRSSSQNKVFMALSQSPRGLDENRSPRASVSPRQQQSPQQPVANGFRKSGFTRVLNPPPLDSKQAEPGRSRYDRLAQRKGIVPFDEPRNDEPSQSSPLQEQEPEEPSTPISVKDRASLFKGGGPRSPEKESMRLSSLNSRYGYERTFVDEGDIPMVSNIGRSPPHQELNTSTQTNTSSYGASTSKSPSYSGSNFTRSSRVLPWDDNQKDDMEQQRRGGVRQPVLYPESKLRRGGDLYSSYAKEEKSERE